MVLQNVKRQQLDIIYLKFVKVKEKLPQDLNGQHHNTSFLSQGLRTDFPKENFMVLSPLLFSKIMI